MHSSLFPRLLLVFALLFAQLGGLAHGISHITSDRSQKADQSLPHDKYCDQCAAYAQIGSAIGSSYISFAASENYETRQPGFSRSFITTAFVAFAARAPPYSA